MADYKRVSDALKEGADPVMLCMTCPWDRFCINPPPMTSEEIEKQYEDARVKDEEAAAKAKAEGKDAPMPFGVLIQALAVGGRDTQCQVCPVLAMRLRSSEGGVIVQSIRSQMQAAG